MIECFHHEFRKESQHSTEYLWIQEETVFFDELLLSWNARRPHTGALTFSVKVKTDKWSPWLHYASWKYSGQEGGTPLPAESLIKVDQDILSIKDTQASGFGVRVEAIGGASLESFYALHACINNRQNYFPCYKASGRAIDLDIPKLSQMKLMHPRNNHMCSPTSTTAVIRYLLRSKAEPLEFAKGAYDEAFNIYGNWALNVAHASHLLGASWRCWVQRLNCFDDILERLWQRTPVVVSVKGPLKGSPLPYNEGHLIVIKGFDPNGRGILCMDPAFPTDGETHAAYPLEDFLEAWERRRRLAYIFEPVNSSR